MSSDDLLQNALEHHKSGDFHKAIEIYYKLLEKTADPKILNFLALALKDIGDYKSALEHIHKALALAPGFVEAIVNSGIIMNAMGDTEKAIKAYQKAISLEPALSTAYFNLANVFNNKKDYDKAIVCYKKALELDPLLHDTYRNLAQIYATKKMPSQAIEFYLKAIGSSPSNAELHNNLGVVLFETDNIDEAIECYRKALTLDPDYAAAYYNLGNALRADGNIEEAIDCYKHSVKNDNSLSYAHWNLAILLLLTGRFDEGWQEYEWRWELKNYITKRDFARPLWDGTDLNGKTILLHTEQGFGDAIQFIRYVPLIEQRGGRIIIECQKELISLFSSIKGIADFKAQGEGLPPFDLHCPFLTIPYIFKTTNENIPSKTPYLTVNNSLVQKWTESAGIDRSRFNIGIVWAGNPRNLNDRQRSLSLDLFSAFSGLKNIQLYSLQKGPASEQINSSAIPIKDPTAEIKDFSDTAALIMGLDLVISVDTAVAHLAGALSRPVWLLIPPIPDWRWQLNREDSPWYPTMRLFRGTKNGQWNDVIERIKNELLCRQE
ncbi:MAG: tetratricopeptide repeat protein [Nitrospirae bacterium]|nr:MAG: tetratricopeptide repeat protein [Nitrospirota bacterium]